VTYSVAPDDATKTQTTESVKTGDLQYTVGGLVTAFDGALGYSVGWTLNSPRTRLYQSIGVSLFSATEKARELFKGLSK
jgi:hypothetical protein